MSRVRIVSYAINGRGMGHLVRQLAILRWVRRFCNLLDVRAELWVLTSSEADTLARREGFPSLKMPSKAMIRDADLSTSRYLAIARTWVMNAVAGLQPDLLLVDTFPGGSFGELVPTLELARHRILVARRVRAGFAAEDAYQALLPLYSRVIVPDDRDVGPILIRDRDELHSRDAARRALGIGDGRRAVYVTLGGGADVAAASTLPRLVDRLRERDWHVVVGAGPLYRGPERRGDGITWLERYTPMELLPGVDAAVSAAGYNSFHELMFCGVPTVFLPQPRIADDQEGRAARAEAAGAGRVASSIDDVPDLLEDPGTADAARALVPINGARAAALAVLAPLVDARDLAFASEVLGPDVVRLTQRLEADASPEAARKLPRLLRLLCGDLPSQSARHAAALHELRDRGYDVPEVEPEPAGDLARFVRSCDQHGVPLGFAIQLVTSVQRTFPAATSPEIVEGCETLFAAWARFDDWMGALSILRTVPTQRTLTVPAFARQLAAWLEHEDDLFDAVRALARLEKLGERTIAESLRILTDRAAS